MNQEELDNLSEEEYEALWVCDLCGKSTFKTEYDYLISTTRHLGCQLELELNPIGKQLYFDFYDEL